MKKILLLLATCATTGAASKPAPPPKAVEPTLPDGVTVLPMRWLYVCDQRHQWAYCDGPRDGGVPLDYDADKHLCRNPTSCGPLAQCLFADGGWGTCH